MNSFIRSHPVRLDFPTTPGAYDPTFNGGSTLSFNFNGTTFNEVTDIYANLIPTGFALWVSTYSGMAAE